MKRDGVVKQYYIEKPKNQKKITILYGKIHLINQENNIFYCTSLGTFLYCYYTNIEYARRDKK